MVMRIDRKQRDGRFVPFLELHVAPGECHRDIGVEKADAPKHETGLADSVDRLEGVPVRRLYGRPPVQLSPKIWMKLASSANTRRKAHAVVTIPRGLDLLQDSLDDLLISTHVCPPERADIPDLSAQTVRILHRAYKGQLALRQNFNPKPKTGGSCILSLPKTSSGPSQLLRDTCNNVAGPAAGEITIRQPQGRFCA